MGKQLVIAEKPSVARDIAAALGGFEDKGEYLESDEFVVAWAVGHLLALAEPQEYDKRLKSWSIKHLPIIPDEFRLAPRNGQKKRLAELKKLARRADVEGLINACDAGREGELIFRRILEYDGVKKPVRRLWLQSMTRQAIRDGFAHLRAGHDLDDLADAAWLRSVGDWLIGMNATRALTQRLKSRGEKGAWSAGRVQTPTLHMLVAREREILAHEPRPYWQLFATFSHDEQTWEGRYWDASVRSDDRDVQKDRIFDRALADALLAGVRATGHGLAEETRKKARQNPPLPFDLTSLQREANKRFSYSARRTLDAAQRLYETHKLITYPRTDSRHLPDDYEPTVLGTLNLLAADHEYGALASGILQRGPLNLDRILDGSKVSDHFAIIPTDAAAGALGSDDLRIYDLVVRQFLAAMMGPATWEQVERLVTVRFDGHAPVFRTTARHLEVPGFLEALGKEEGAGTHLPALVPGRDGVRADVQEVREEEKTTTPPPRYNEGTLLRMMETAGEEIEDDDLSEAIKDKGIGTPATRAEIIEGLVRKQYARRVDGRLAPTSKAMRLMDVIDRVDVPTLASPHLTGAWEYDLKQVESGRLPKDAMYKRLADFTRDVTRSLTTFEHDRLYADEPSLGTCPECGKGQVTENPWGYPCSRNTDKDSPCNFMIWKDRAGRYMDRATVRKLVAQRRVGPVAGFVDRYGRGLEGTLVLREDPDKGRWVVDVEFGQPTDGEEEKAQGVLCANPEDPEDDIVETNLRYVSRRILDGATRKGPVLPKVVCHREIAPEEARQFFSEAGRTEILDDFVSKRGRPFRGALIRKPTGKHGFEFPPREPRAKAGAAKASSAKKPAAKKATARKTTAKKPATRKRPAKKKAGPAAPRDPAGDATSA